MVNTLDSAFTTGNPGFLSHGSSMERTGFRQAHSMESHRSPPVALSYLKARRYFANPF